jgi:hypothetical protein
VRAAIRVQQRYLGLSELDGSDRRRRRIDREAFWSYVDQSGGLLACWPWMAGRDPGGYGQGPFGWTRKAHREAYRLIHGEFDHALDVCHSCDNPPCCNPAHLWTGTRSDNILDARDKGRLNTARGSRSGQSKLTEDQVRAIRQRLARGESHRVIGRAFGVSGVAVHFIAAHKTWAHLDAPVAAEAAS